MACLATCTAGCASARLERRIAAQADRYHVPDASARRTGPAAHLRFNALILSDLDDALRAPDEATVRRSAALALRSAAALARRAAAGEIDRLPPAARERLAAEAGSAPAAGPGAALGTTIVPKTANQARAGDRATAADVLRTRYDHTASAALQRDLLDVERLPLERLRNKLRAYRRGVEPLPDERGRLTRTLALAWAAIPAWIGLEREEAKLRSKADAKVAKRFDRVAVWRSATQGRRDLLRRYAPTIAVEWPQDRGYPIDDDRIGTVRLAGGPGAVEVHIDPASPALYAYTWTAKIHGRRHRQLVYVWWFPERPEMTPRDPSAGRIDGGMLRITLDARDRPLIVESSLNCGCGHQVFVSAALEASARRAYGGPLPGKRFATEQHMRGKHDVIVIDTFDLPDDKTRPRPVIYVAAGYHEVCRVTFADPAQRDGVRVVADAAYALMDYRVLERLPLGDGVASMFGADGLVHGAGRPEGYLLAPTGILSAGQPRQRGTHRIRWDDFLFDDPHLLERTLRWPTYTAP